MLLLIYKVKFYRDQCLNAFAMYAFGYVLTYFFLKLNLSDLIFWICTDNVETYFSWLSRCYMDLLFCDWPMLWQWYINCVLVIFFCYFINVLFNFEWSFLKVPSGMFPSFLLFTIDWKGKKFDVYIVMLFSVD